MRGRTILVLAVLTAVLAAVLAGGAGAIAPGANGRIFYESNQTAGGIHNIWSINPDGTSPTQLTNVPNNSQAAHQPSVSADGNKVVYWEFGDINGHFNTSQIWIMNADGSGQTQLTPTTDNIEDWAPDLSPDGNTIVFQRIDESGGATDIWSMNANGTGETQLTSSTDTELSPKFSPDGTKILYVRQSPTNQIWIMNADGSNQHVLLANPGQQDRAPSWSPDGTKIVYAEDGNGLYVMNADGSSPTQLLDGSGHAIPAQDPTWSPDGTKIAFYAAPGGAPGAGLYTVPATGGSNPTPLVLTGDFESEHPSWAAIVLRTLSVAKTGAGSGSVTSSPAGISCGATCSAGFTPGTQVTLTASPAAGSAFAGWSGGGCSGTGTCVVAMNSDQTVTATFNVVHHTLTVQPAGDGSGSVSSSPAGIDCGATCSASLAAGTTVTLTATPAAGSTFGGWSGGGCSGTGTCVVTLNADQTVTASFALQPPDTTITKSTISATHRRASFAFSAVGTATGFECRLSRHGHPAPAFTACTSPKRYRHLHPGRYTFAVRALNQTLADPTPATKRFTIKS